MENTQYFLAFDLGASSGRGIIGTLTGGKLTLTEVHRFPNGPTERNGHIYWDYPALCAELEAGLAKALQQVPHLDGIGVDTWGVDYVLFDRKTMTPKALPFHYRDGRTDTMIADLARTIPDAELYGHTGIQFMQFNTIYQLAATRRDDPALLEDAIMLFMPDALAFHLSGEASTEYSIASTGALLNAATRDWDWEIIDKAGLPRALFTPLVAPGSRGGVLRKELQEKLHCGPIPVFKVAGHDTASAVAAVPAPADRPWAYVSAGTWALLGAELNAPQLTDAARLARFTNEGGVNRTIRFLTNIMGSWLFQETRRVWNEAGRNLSFADLEKMSDQAEPFAYVVDPNAKPFLPPGNMPERVRAFLRATKQAAPDAVISDEQVLGTLYDSLALYFRECVRDLEKLLNVRYAALNIVGGGTRDRKLMQLTADALGIPVIAGPVEATATGNLAVQAMAAGSLRTLAEVRQVVAASTALTTYQPRPERAAGFDRLAARFAALPKP